MSRSGTLTVAGSTSSAATNVTVNGRAAPRFVPRTTAGEQDEPIAPNRLAERAAPDGPNPIWLQDSTCLPPVQG